jgi:hypothetical protein
VVDISGLDIGYYSCELTVADPCAENSPQTVTVNLEVEVLGPKIELSATQFTFMFLWVGGWGPVRPDNDHS